MFVSRKSNARGRKPRRNSEPCGRSRTGSKGKTCIMRLSDKWKDYELIDTSDGERLERWGDIILIRPDPQIIWSSEKKNPLWYSAHARYHRSNRGGGSWEQAVNWDFAAEKIKNENRPLKILNLFGYTGCATLACMNAGATVCHVDASKGMVQWAKENAASSGIADRPVRWLVDDCVKFVQREIRRGNRYDGIIMDPPSYGRGPGGEVWKLEEQLYSLVTLCKQVLSDNPLFFILNSYTTGLSPAVMEYLLGVLLQKDFGGKVSSDEIGLKVSDTGLVLPCGSTAIWEK